MAWMMEKLSAACDGLFGVNVKGCILGAKAALPELQKTEGCMVFTAPVAGMNAAGGGTLYCQDDRPHGAESGWEGRVRANNPLHMVLEPADLAGAYVFLASRTNAGGITGTIVTVDSGSTLRRPRRS